MEEKCLKQRKDRISLIDYQKLPELFLIQQLPEILDKVTSVVSENLSIDHVTVLDRQKENR
jgi:hypothetical protein